MKCMYYLAPTLASTREISADLHDVGIEDYYLHVIAKDEAGLKQEHIHSSNYLETLDLIREGVIGGLIGMMVGLLGVGLTMYFKPFSFEVPTFVYVIFVGFATLFGTWEGGLAGIGSENRKLVRFHDDVEAGKYLMLVYVRKEKESTVADMMQRRHPDAELAAVDRHFVNPFSSPKRLSESAIPRT
jgi:hypothetical protein